jgi:ApeA N-terminal domain 1
MIDPDRKQWFGEFKIGNDPIFGELTIDGPKTNLYLQSEKDFLPSADGDRTIHGALQDKRNVTLIDCNIPLLAGTSSSQKGSYSFTNIFPHHVVIGESRVYPHKKTVSGISWRLDDTHLAFYDFDAFGTSLNPTKFIKPILAENEKKIGRKIKIGTRPQIQYFSGRLIPFSCDVGFGKFTVLHDFGSTFGGTSGVWMNNKMQCVVEFRPATDFHSALQKIYEISTFLGVVVGRPQNMDGIRLKLARQPKGHRWLEVIPSLPTKRNGRESVFGVGPSDVLLDGIRRQTEFSKVLRQWLDDNRQYEASRGRFWDSFKKQSYHDADRIIAAANMFDVIPSFVFSEKIELADEFLGAIDASKKLFEKQPETQQRGDILGALSRLSKQNLKPKIKHWAADIDRSSDGYEYLDYVIDRAVECRNFFVHGSGPEFDYSKNIILVKFLTTALELCYVFPQFIKAGWDWKHWKSESGSMHPFGDFTYYYGQNLQKLRDIVTVSKNKPKNR